MEVKLLMARLTKEEQWKAHIKTCTASGMSIKAWCKQNNLSPHQYHYWKSKFNEIQAKTKPQDELPQWAPLITDAPVVIRRNNAPIVMQVGNFKLELTPGFDKQTLLELVNILGELC